MKRSSEFDSSDGNKRSKCNLPLNKEIALMIEEELRRADNDITEPPVLTAKQTQSICERIIRDREQKLRDEYNRALNCRIAEQSTFVETTKYPTYLHSTPHQGHSINALAALTAFSAIHRTTGAVNNLSDPSANGRYPSAFSLDQAVLGGATNNIPLGPVLLASNLDEQLATPEALFTLFGVFGDVVRVKILFNKKDNALVQMADANQAQVAQSYLDKQKVFGKTVRVTRSKHQLVQMPREGNQSDAGLTKDFTNSPLHRFKFPGSRNYLNIYPPSSTLHISNIPATIDEGHINKAFKEACGFDYSSFKFFPKDRKMALMKFNSIEHATIALIKMHNFPINEENNLRVSFSKSVMQP